MNTKSFLITVLMLALGINVSMSQTTFTQTTTSDFAKGTGQNVIIGNDCVSLQSKMSAFLDWEASANLPQNLMNHQIVTWQNYVFCVGGYNGSNPVNTVYRATQQTSGISGWTTLNALPVALKDMAVAATQTKLIVLGGRNNDGVSDKIYEAGIKSDYSIESWTESPFSLPQPLWGARAIVVHDNIYLIGGAPTDTPNDATNKVYLLKLNAAGSISSITEVTDLPEARNDHAVASYDSKIYVTGGYDASHTLKSSVYCATVNLDGTIGTWQSQTNLPIAISNHTSVCANGILTMMGGWEGELPSNKFYYADLDATQFNWAMSDVMLSERTHDGVSFAFGNQIFYSGGQNLSGSIINYGMFY